MMWSAVRATAKGSMATTLKNFLRLLLRPSASNWASTTLNQVVVDSAQNGGSFTARNARALPSPSSRCAWYAWSIIFTVGCVKN